MKKFVIAVLTFSCFFAFAELYPARRYVEVGTTANVMAGQNAMPFTEIFKKHLVLDLRKIYSQMSGDGVTVFANTNESFFINCDFSKFGLGLHCDSSLSMRMNISKELFKVMEGITPGTVYSGEANVWLESFAVFSVPIRFNIEKFKIKVIPSYFVPMLYVPYTSVTGSACNGTDGSVVARAVAPLEIYTISEFKGLIKNGEFSTDFTNHIDGPSLMSDMITSGGIDLGASVEYPILETLDIGGYLRTPIFPGRLKHKITTMATLSVKTDSLMKMIIDNEEPDTTAKLEDAYYSDSKYTVNRPMRLGAECAWRPVGNWLTLRAMLGAALRNPFGEDFSIKSLYPEYRFGVDVVGLGMFGLTLSTEYTSKVFAHGIGIMLNFRAVEFDFSAALCSSDFVQSFKGEGAAAGVGVKFGW